MDIIIACGQPEVIPGRPDLNTEKILGIIDKAREADADLLLLPEMAVPGYLIGDLWEQPDFLRDCEEYGRRIIAASHDITVIFGNVAVDWARCNTDGHPRRYNAAFIAQNGRALPVFHGMPYIPKSALPQYREFDDARYFSSCSTFLEEMGETPESGLHPIQLNLKIASWKIGIMLCEDGWTGNYPLDLPALLAEKRADLLCNLSCSPFTLGKEEKRHSLFGGQARQAGRPLVYCNQVGVQNNGKNIYTFDGASTWYNPDGSIALEAGPYEECLLVCAWDKGKDFTPLARIPLGGAEGKALSATKEVTAKTDDGKTDSTSDAETASIYRALRFGTERFLRQCGIRKMVVGLSGGIDSAVTAALYADILGPENLLLVNMPGPYNSDTTKSIAARMAEALAANYAVFPIGPSYEHTVEQLSTIPVRDHRSGEDFHLELTGLMKENIQARDRGARLLAGLAAAFGGGFSCNANKAEISVGYGTFYGDIAGLLAPIGDLWKHQVYALGRYFNDHVFHREVLPKEIFTVAPSAELSPEQTVGRGGDPLVYPYHDYLLRAFQENWDKASPGDILERYMDGTLEEFLGCRPGIVAELFPDGKAFCEDLERWYRQFAGLAVAKRIQAPPVLSVSRRAYGYDYREAQLPIYFSLKYKELKERLLAEE